MSGEIMEACRSKDRDLIRAAMLQAIRQVESMISPSNYKAAINGMRDRGLAWLLEQVSAFKEAPEGFRRGEMLVETPMGCVFNGNSRYLLSLVAQKVAVSGPADFFEHMDKIWMNQGRGTSSQLRQITNHKQLPACFDFTALHEKAARGDKIDSGALAELKALVNVQDVCGWSPLLYAAAAKNWEMVDQFFDLEADPTLADYHGYTVAHHACLSGCRKTLDILWRWLVKLDYKSTNGVQPIHLAAGKGHCDLIKDLLMLEFSEVHARRKDQLEPKDFNNRMPVHWAAAGGHPQVVELFRGDINAQDDCGWSPLHIATLASQKHLISTLYQLSADVESRDFKGRTPLILACAEGKWEVVGELVKIGAKVYGADSDDMTALHYVVAKGATALVSILTEGLDGKVIQHLTTLRNRDGQTPLHLAAMDGTLEMINKLVELGADADFANNQGESPLFLSLARVETDEAAFQFAKALVRGSTWLGAKSVDGRSLLDVANNRRFPRVVKFLEAERERLQRET